MRGDLEGSAGVRAAHASANTSRVRDRTTDCPENIAGVAERRGKSSQRVEEHGERAWWAAQRRFAILGLGRVDVLE